MMIKEITLNNISGLNIDGKDYTFTEAMQAYPFDSNIPKVIKKIIDKETKRANEIKKAAVPVDSVEKATSSLASVITHSTDKNITPATNLEQVLNNDSKSENYLKKEAVPVDSVEKATSSLASVITHSTDKNITPATNLEQVLNNDSKYGNYLKQEPTVETKVVETPILHEEVTITETKPEVLTISEEKIEQLAAKSMEEAKNATVVEEVKDDYYEKYGKDEGTRVR